MQSLFVALAATLCITSSTVGDDQQEAYRVETQVFDIRSLLLEVPDYRAVFSDLRSDDLYGPAVPRQDCSPDPPPQPKTAAATSADTQKENAEIIMEMIQTVVDTYSWSEHGGDMGTVRFYAGQLVVSQTPENLAKIKRLLDLLAAARSSTVRIEAYFLRVPSAGPEREAASDLILETSLSLAEFNDWLETAKELVTVTRASVCGFDGQRVFAMSGRQVNAIVGANAVVAEAVSANEPVVRQLMGGVTFESQPVIDRDRDTVLLDLRASLAEVEPVQHATALENPLETGMAAPPYRVAHFACSLSLPLDKVSLVGTAPYDEQNDVLLFIRPTVDQR
jgi:hypothetical protein